MHTLASGLPPFNAGELIAVLAVGGSFVVGTIAIVFGCLTNVAKVKAQEQTKREIAAYVAEGSISPEDARRILAASGSIGEQIKEKIRQSIGA